MVCGGSEVGTELVVVLLLLLLLLVVVLLVLLVLLVLIVLIVVVLLLLLLLLPVAAIGDRRRIRGLSDAATGARPPHDRVCGARVGQWVVRVAFRAFRALHKATMPQVGRTALEHRLCAHRSPVGARPGTRHCLPNGVIDLRVRIRRLHLRVMLRRRGWKRILQPTVLR